MRLFLLSWSGKEAGLEDVARTLKAQSHEILYWSYFDHEEINRSQFPGTIFHKVSDALAGRPANGVDDLPAPPFGGEFIEQFRETESVVLTMMNKRFEYTTLDERKHLYYKMLRYWWGVIQKFKPDAIVYLTIPHTVYDFVAYAIAEKLGIKNIMFDPALISDCLLLMDDYEKGSFLVAQKLEEIRGKKFSAADLGPVLREYYERQTDKTIDNTPRYLIEQKNAFLGLNLLRLKLGVLWRSIKDHSFFRKLVNYAVNKFGPNLQKEYLKFQSRPDLNEKYVYVPLNYQPERTLSPQGGVFVDQLLMVEMLSEAVPEGWKVYVKEHPLEWVQRGTSYFSYRYRGYYEAIAKLKNVKLIPLGTNTYSLTNNAQAVATVNGTASWEAVLRSKPSLVFGYAWYQQCPEVFKVRSSEDCKKVFKMIQSGFKVNPQNVIGYLFCLERAGVHGYTDNYGKSISKISHEENVRNLAEAIIVEAKRRQ